MKNTLILILCAVISVPVFSQDWALKKLESSSRHQEDVNLKAGDRTIHCFVVYPEVSNKANVVILIHENRGLTDWVRYMADQVAAEGFIAIAPDLLSGKAPNGGGTSDFANSDDARQAIYALNPDEVTAALNATYDYANTIPAGNGKISVAGFCWGGTQSFRYATNNNRLKASFVFYGTGPENKEDIEKINDPVYGFYGGSDERVDATIEGSKQMMKETGKTYEPVIYKGATHAFMRAGQEPDATPDNKAARDAAFARFIDLLKKI